jgi:hypothetical protein
MDDAAEYDHLLKLLLVGDSGTARAASASKVAS